MSEIVMCSHFKDKPAVARFSGMGMEGFCSMEYKFLLDQTASQSGQHMNYAPLAPVAPPVTRDERAQLIAARLSAEEEARQVAERSAALFEQNVKLRQQVQDGIVRENELKAQVGDRQAEIAEVQSKLDTSRSQVVQLSAEVERLEVLVGNVEVAEQRMIALQSELDASKSRVAELEQQLAAQPIVE